MIFFKSLFAILFIVLPIYAIIFLPSDNFGSGWELIFIYMGLVVLPIATFCSLIKNEKLTQIFTVLLAVIIIISNVFEAFNHSGSLFSILYDFIGGLFVIPIIALLLLKVLMYPKKEEKKTEE